jgi:hypothetical protein
MLVFTVRSPPFAIAPGPAHFMSAPPPLLPGKKEQEMTKGKAIITGENKTKWMIGRRDHEQD